MGKLIGKTRASNLGEQIFIDRATEFLDDDCIIYWNRQVRGREFDVCILIPDRGILVVEVKGWQEGSIARAGDNCVVVKTNEGEIEVNPQKQVRSYRYILETLVRQSVGKFPLVLHMVCLPQISLDVFEALRLDAVLEKQFTFIKEDLTDNASFFRKLNEALQCAALWNRDAFDKKLMLDVRRLFESEVIDDSEGTPQEMNPECRGSDYSRFYYFPDGAEISECVVEEIMRVYMSGCKLYCVFGGSHQMLAVIEALDKTLYTHGLRRNRDNLEVIFDGETHCYPPADPASKSFSGFHFTFHVLNPTCVSPQQGITVIDGEFNPQERKTLQWLSDNSEFNVEQYFIEHADMEKNIIIRAGAGTGKTYTMISRIAYLCYKASVPLPEMAQRILMITFTNEAADQMASRLKSYFRNCCLLQSGHKGAQDYLEMMSKIDHIQICTIHILAKQMISQLGTDFGYGIDLNVTSGDYLYREIISDLLDRYIAQKSKEYGPAYSEKLGVPVYAVRDCVLDIIRKLHNKSVDIGALDAKNFGTPACGGQSAELHTLLSELIPSVEREYAAQSLAENRIHLGTMMSSLYSYLRSPGSRGRLKELAGNETRFLFVDEFQDTDDTQIKIIRTLADALHYRMFLVGDIKQCIYRFRGAEEKAFDQVGVQESPDQWLAYSLRRNYRTDIHLLRLYDVSFSHWNEGGAELLDYQAEVDSLIGTCDYNGYQASYPGWPDKFFSRLEIQRDNQRMQAVIGEIIRLKKRIQYEAGKGMTLTQRERSIAILVRENWQAEEVRKACLKAGIRVQTNTGGDLYVSQPAIDMITLVNALVHFDEADYLYAFLSSNFFRLHLPKANLYELRREINEGEWKSRKSERDMVSNLMKCMQVKLSNLSGPYAKWEYVIRSLRTRPVLQVLRELYEALEPWKGYLLPDECRSPL